MAVVGARAGVVARHGGTDGEGDAPCEGRVWDPPLRNEGMAERGARRRGGTAGGGGP